MFALCNSCTKNTFEDKRDNKVYKTVKIGNKIWMAENLNFDLDNQGSYYYPSRMLNIDSVTLNEALDFYHIDKKTIVGLKGIELLKAFSPQLDSALKKYPDGWRYYTYDAAKKACPDGWRLPNNEDWKELNLYPINSILSIFSHAGVAWWREDYHNPILEIRLGDYFGGSNYWSGSETSDKIWMAYPQHDGFHIDPARKSNGFNTGLGFSIRCIKKDDSK